MRCRTNVRPRIVLVALIFLIPKIIFLSYLLGLYSFVAKPAIIFAATTFYGEKMSSKDFLDSCPKLKTPCIISEDPAHFAQASAVIFHGTDFKFSSMDLPGERNLNIPYIYWTMESPSNDIVKAPAWFINWTMTYKKNSDIWMPYGRLIPAKSGAKINPDELWARKNISAHAIWIASNCDTPNKRLEMVKALQFVGLRIDIFGKCGQPVPKNCDGLNKQWTACMDEVISPYKFYIAIENSNCPDYVTEKFYNNLKRGAVPIVGKRSIYEKLGLPLNSFIAVDDFFELRALREFIEDMTANPQDYAKFHAWQENYEVLTGNDPDIGWCKLCSELQNPTTDYKTYADLRAWMIEDGCDDGIFDTLL